MKTKLMADFQIFISVPKSTEKGEDSFHSVFLNP